MPDFFSGLAYLAVCLSIAVSGARKRCPPEESTPENSGPRRPPPLSLFLSCLISLLVFLLVPCGTLPSLLPVPGGALLALGGLVAAPGLLALSAGREAAYRRAWVPLSLGVSLGVIARYAEQRGVPGELFTLDAYVAMPIIGVAEGAGKAGIGILAAASLFVLRVSFEEKPPDGDQAFPAALSAELWALAAAAFWVCLFFPFSFAYSGGPEGWVLDALVFWGKVTGLNWFLGRRRRKFRSAWIHGAILLVFLEIGAGLLLGAAE
ncbi:MAG: hypothetical protein LBE85_10755 [Candidatus Accumulibacter sp.]|nr:hypothetical protein [Accumulibacter sp.]